MVVNFRRKVILRDRIKGIDIGEIFGNKRILMDIVDQSILKGLGHLEEIKERI